MGVVVDVIPNFGPEMRMCVRGVRGVYIKDCEALVVVPVDH